MNENNKEINDNLNSFPPEQLMLEVTCMPKTHIFSLLTSSYKQASTSVPKSRKVHSLHFLPSVCFHYFQQAATHMHHKFMDETLYQINIIRCAITWFWWKQLIFNRSFVQGNTYSQIMLPISLLDFTAIITHMYGTADSYIF